MLDKTKLPDVLGSGLCEFEDFIPVTCHCDPCTLLTKDGFTIQSIAITGEGFSSSHSGEKLHLDLSKVLDEAIQGYNISVYLHTIRERKSVMLKHTHVNPVFAKLEYEWSNHNGFDNELCNTVYISLVYQMDGIIPGNLAGILGNALPKKFASLVRGDIAESVSVLTHIADSIVAKLSKYGARKLALLESDDGAILSEPLMLYYHLYNLSRARVEIDTVSAAEQINRSSIKFHFSNLDLETEDIKTYAAIFSFKDESHISYQPIHDLLQLQTEYILTQSVVFVPSKGIRYQDTAVYEHGSKKIGGLISLEQSFNNERCCKMHTTLAVFATTELQLEKNIRAVTKKLSDIGISYIREDFNMPSLFLAQMPGNFKYLSNARYYHSPVEMIGRYCMIFDRQAGDFQGSKWGEPISIIRSLQGTPFYFNFHNDAGVGNTFIIGPKGTGKTVLSRFFLVQAMKVKPRILYLDLSGCAQEFIESIGGVYIQNEVLRTECKLNPFLPTTLQSTHDMLKDWLHYIVMPREKLLKEYDDAFNAIVEKIIKERNEIPDIRKAICDLLAYINDSSINSNAEAFFGGEDSKFARYLTERNQTQIPLFQRSEDVIGVDLHNVAEDWQLLQGYLGIFFAKTLDFVMGSADRPTIIFIDHFEKLYQVKHIRCMISGYMQKLSERNSILLANCIHHEAFENDEHYQRIINALGTSLFLSDKKADKYFRKCYDLSEDELHKVKSYSAEKHMMLVRQGSVSKTLFLNLKEIKESIVVLDAQHD